jgi:hypothetical protein
VVKQCGEPRPLAAAKLLLGFADYQSAVGTAFHEGLDGPGRRAQGISRQWRGPLSIRQCPA